jgi:hypothetical protein
LPTGPCKPPENAVLMRLFAFLRPDRDLSDQVQALSTKVAELEATELSRELRTVELHDQIKRMLARMDTHAQRQKQKDDPGPESDRADPVTIALLRAKYPKNGG